MSVNRRQISVCVVGGGVVGVSTALNLLEKAHHNKDANISVTIISESLTPNTTGDGSAGFWMPYLMPNNTQQEKYQWCADTYRHIERLYKTSNNANSIGINLLSGYIIFKDGDEIDTDDAFWSALVYGFRQVTDDELKMFPNAKSGVYFTTYTVECVKYLPYLLEKFTRLGGKIVQRRVNSFNELSRTYDIICNCSGFGAKLLARDDSMVAIRGQVIRVSAPWLKHFVVSGDNYILPNSDTVVLGGTHQERDECTEPYRTDTDFILNGCQQLVPSLKDARIVKHWVGLRPGRPTIKIELDTSGNVPVIHNYGHAGSGVTVHWGCALDAADLVLDYIKKQPYKLPAKL